MNIGIISQIKEKNIAGINRVTMGTVTELLKLDKNNEYYFVGKTDWLNLPLESIPILPDMDCAIRLNYTVNSYPLDIIHSHYKAFDLNAGFSCAKILTIHDLIPLLYPKWYGNQYDYFNEVLRKCAHSADVVIAVSQYTKNDIVEHYRIKEEKIKVVYNGLYPADLFGEVKQCEAVTYLENQRFILSVSGISPHKNQLALVEAFLLYKQRNPNDDVKLLLTGPIRQYQVVRDILEKYKEITDSIVFTGYVSDEQLVWIYQKALSFIYVSIYEGFGLPILEALSLGKAVICSNVTSMPEVGGDAVEYCNPHDIESIADAIEHVVSDDVYRRELESKAIIQANKFSYKKTAEQTLEIYKSFVK